MKKRVMTFGVFDGLHEGHRAFLRAARQLGDYLIVVVAQDRAVQDLKGRPPKHDMSTRRACLEKHDGVDAVVAGDEAAGTWEVVRTHRPDVIALGYDQEAMRRELERARVAFTPRPELRMLGAYKPETYKSSLLNRK